MSVEKASSWVGSTDGEIIELAGSEPPVSAYESNSNTGQVQSHQNRIEIAYRAIVSVL